jgi:hypothetical protein
MELAMLFPKSPAGKNTSPSSTEAAKIRPITISVYIEAP